MLEDRVPQPSAAFKDRRESKGERRKTRRSMEHSQTSDRSGDHVADLQTLGETVDIRGGGDTFTLPTPPPHLPPKSATFQAEPSPLAAGESTPVGVAIGSHTHVLPAWGRSFTSTQIPNRIDRQAPPLRAFTMQTGLPTLLEGAPRAGELRKKKSSWKTFGGILKRHSAKDESHVVIHNVSAEPETAALIARPLIETPLPSPGALQSPTSISSHQSRIPSAMRGMVRLEARAEADQVSSMPNIERLRNPLSQRGSMLRAPMLLGNFRDSEDMFTVYQDDRKDSAMTGGGVVVPGAIPRTPRLDLDVPSGKMERYSVMFEKLLEPRQSILERRQSRLMMLSSQPEEDTVTTALVEDQQIKQQATNRCLPSLPQIKKRPSQSNLPQRSATSPHLTKVPSLNVIVPKRDRTSMQAPVIAVTRPRPVQRSNTAPPGAASPVALNFSRLNIQTFGSSGSHGSGPSLSCGDSSLSPTPTTMTTVTDFESIVPLSRNPQSLRARGMEDFEPSWDMLTSHSSGWSTDGDVREPYPRVRSPEELERHMVQVSVARQVSVSRARRHVQKAVDSKQPLKPRVVELSRNRKSTFVVIESGDD